MRRLFFLSRAFFNEFSRTVSQFSRTVQCTKFRVHHQSMRPSYTILTIWWTHSDTYASGGCTLFQSISISIHHRPVHKDKKKLLDARFCVPLHPVWAQNICLISNTACCLSAQTQSLHLRYFEEKVAYFLNNCYIS